MCVCARGSFLESERRGIQQLAASKFRVWLEHYRFVEPLIDSLVKHGKKPDMSQTTIDKQLVCAIGAVNEVARECRRDKATDESVKKMAGNVFSWVQMLPSDFQVAAVKSTLSMELISKWHLTKVPEVMATYLNVRKAMGTGR